MSIKNGDLSPRSGGFGVARRGTAENNTKPIVTATGPGDQGHKAIRGAHDEDQAHFHAVGNPGEKNEGELDGCIAHSLSTGKTDQ